MSGDRVPWPLAYLWAELYTFNPALSRLRPGTTTSMGI